MGLFSKNEVTKFPWIPLTSESQLDELMLSQNPIVLFKHSTTCSISNMALSRFENKFKLTEGIELIYLDLLNFRSVSNYIAEKTGVIHQSPQCIALNNGTIIYQATHGNIDANELTNVLSCL